MEDKRYNAKAYYNHYYKQHKDRYREHSKQYYATHREEIREYAKHYYNLHKDEITCYNRQYYLQNREEIREADRKRYVFRKQLKDQQAREDLKTRVEEFKQSLAESPPSVDALPYQN